MGKGLQEDSFMCGPAALQRALKCHHVKVSQTLLAKVCGTTEGGTDEHDLIRGIGHLGFVPEPYTTDHWNKAIDWLDGSLIAGVPSLLSVRVEEAYDHWVCCYGGLGARGTMEYLIFDPGNWAPNFEEYGSNVYTRKELLRYWRAPLKERDPGDLAYYAIGVHRR